MKVNLAALSRALFGWSLLLVVSSCQLLGLGGVEVESVAQTTNKPGQVGVYVSVREDGNPVTLLEAKHFKLTEDETQLDPAQVQLQLLPRDAVAAHQVLVLVDLSGNIDEPGRRALLAKQLAPFIDRLRAKQHVSVYGFDGGEKLYPFGKFEQEAPKPGAPLPEFPGLLTHKQADSSSNLNGALLTAISQLDFELNQTSEPIKLGRLVVITRGPDLAGRTSKERLDERLGQISHHVFALGIEQEPNTGFTEEIGRNGHIIASSVDNMESQLADLATMVEADFSQYYLLSYCSPARSGQRVLLVEVTSPKDESTGQVEIQFSSDGFASGCDASKVPRFEGQRGAKPRAPSAPAEPPPSEPTPTEEPAATAEPSGEVPPPASPAYAE
jgi:hypothetical protein